MRAPAYPCFRRLGNAKPAAPRSVIAVFLRPDSVRIPVVSLPLSGGWRETTTVRRGAALVCSFLTPPVSRPPSRVSASLDGVETVSRLSADTLKAAIDPEGFYRAALNLKGKPNAQGWVLVVCPFHGDSDPSLSVNLKHGGFHCFGCGEKGDLISFHAKLHRLSFRDAVNDLARRYLL